MQFFDENRIWKTGELVKAIRNALEPEYGPGEAKAMTGLIFFYLKGWNQTDLIINSDREVSSYVVSKVNGILERVAKGEPIQYVLGEARFYGMNLAVTPDVLIPRPETEELVDMIVNRNTCDDLRVLDIGTGSGAIAVALSRNLPFSRVAALDISEGALHVARLNAKRLNARIDFIHDDIFRWEPQPEAYDIIVSNPPYVAESEKKDMSRNVLEHEPHGALFVSDSHPLVYYSRISSVAMEGLVPGGRLYFEINPLYASELRSLLETDGYADVEILQDISRRPRFAAARKQLITEN